MRYASSAIVVLTCIGCGTLNGARPLDKGQHAAGATLGGPVLTAFGAHIPLPSLVLEGRSGLSPIQGRATDVNYGLNATAAAFGILDTHVGVSHMLLDQQDRRPALSVTERLHLLSNHLDTTKAMDTRALYAMNQLDVTLSGELGKHLIYGGGTVYWNFVNRPSPGYFLGAQLTPNVVLSRAA